MATVPGTGRGTGLANNAADVLLLSMEYIQGIDPDDDSVGPIMDPSNLYGPNDEPEFYEIWHFPETVLTALWFLRYYMERTPGKARLIIPHYAMLMASRLLSLHAHGPRGEPGRWTKPDYSDDRLRDFGIEPEIREVTDKKRWAIAWSILNRHWRFGCPWRIQSEAFFEQFNAAIKKGVDVPPAGPVNKMVRRKYKVPPRKLYPQPRSRSKPPASTAYRPHNIFQSRASRYLAELDEQ